MREINFRSKRIDTEEWLLGSLVVTNNKHYGITLFTKYDEKEPFRKIDCIIYEVAPETIGQFTGLRDKNGKEIYEGDIVRSISNWGNFGKVGEVIFNEGTYLLDTHDEFFGGKYRYKKFIDKDEWEDFKAHMEVKYEYEVIGNIHDNPELLNRE